MRHGQGEVWMRRRSWPDQAKRDFVEAWKKSGLPKTRFAVENGLSPTSFSKWIEPSTRLGRARAIGRKNWLFAGSEGGAQAAATLLSLIGSCRLHSIDPWGYLNTVLGVINDHPANRVADLTPLRLPRTPAAAL